MKTISLVFNGYWREINKGYISSQSGIYCVYSCDYNETERTVSLHDLLYIGESSNVHDRICNHDRLDDWLSSLSGRRTLCYSFAPVPFLDRERAEAALIFKMQPPFNTEHSREFIYEDTEILTSGKNCRLPNRLVVRRGESHS